MTIAQSATQSKVNHVLDTWLSQYGTTNLRLHAGPRLSAEGSEFDFLMPVHETGDKLLFSQTGIRRVDHRTMLNAGLGRRLWSERNMTGYNLFFDRDLSHRHSRLGAGIELARNDVRLSVNAYLPLSHWKTSQTMEDYVERPARGFDLRGEAWLAALPQLGGRLTYARYYGEEVAISDYHKRFKNPSVIDASLLYSPVPLIILETGQRTLPGNGRRETLAGIRLHYFPGTPLKQQLKPDAVRQQHQLSGSRHDLVDRNNQIVLEYQKSPPVTLALPSRLSGVEDTLISLSPVLHSRHRFAGIEWQAPEFFQAGGSVIHNSQGYQALLPSWKEGSDNEYILRAKARDAKGNVSEPAVVTLTITPELVRISLAGNLSGEEGQTLPMGLNARTVAQVQRVEWNATAFTAAGGKIQQQSSRDLATASLNYYVVLPAYHAGENNVYPVEVTVWDSEGHASDKKRISITVTPSSVEAQLPDIISAPEGSHVPIALSVTARHGLEHLDWQAEAFFAAGGRIDEEAGAFIAIMPTWQPSGNRYPLTVVARDKRGITSQPATSVVQVSSAGITLAFSGDIDATEQEQQLLLPRVTSTSALARIDWQADTFYAAGGTIENNGEGGYRVTLPAWLAGQPNSYEITARATDIQGRQSAPTRFSVKVRARELTLTLPPDITAGEGEQRELDIATSAESDAVSVDIQAPEFLVAGGIISGQGLRRQLTLPPVRNSVSDTYRLTAVAHRLDGQQSSPVSMQVTVTLRPLTLTLGGNITAVERSTQRLTVRVDGPFALKEIAWQADAFLAAGGNIVPDGEGFNLTQPSFKNSETNIYHLTATAIDINDRHSKSVPMSITVTSAQPDPAAQCDVLGGGAGYTGGIDKAAVAYREATDFNTLQALVERGEKYIYISGGTTIEIPNQSNVLTLRRGTTIFSDRGINGSPGGLLRVAYTGETENKYAVITTDSHTRISGLRYEGPYKGTTTRNTTIGIQSLPGSDNIEIDNTELWGWPWAAISVKQSKNIRVHHSFIHDNIRTERGYGVVTQNGDASAEVACNIFNANRHAIAGEGKTGESYSAYHNLVLNGGGRGAYHQFDMHASAGGIAGESISVRDNWFDYGRYGTSNRSSVLLRGQPTTGPAVVENNWFSQGWLNGTNKQVAGLYGSWLAPEEEIISRNTFNVEMRYRALDSERCIMSWLSFTKSINCSAPVIPQNNAK
ncbi:inverse autotransporter beta domain-containing protein [Enterobacter pseudoroggenkampii]|uniref:inverse autotransporter beta domain-containing protein n=1 Tax=Enterobacter pseudoroggenkampii TaxID=2996112 RepID=UPI0025B26640|nr:inverse autotransporter beta domain-containing protein [Enterobacter pseudoroggenkampii]WJW96584.1 inverse autotransporter beta domain-containing protein [Enterobacter pseudoroggenkampii]